MKMCGIAGIYDEREKVSMEKLIRMAEIMAHRGPDSTGFFISENKTMGLAHDRLSIIDLTPAANQPMSNENKSLWLVFNGEIYNHHLLREKLVSKGHKFKSRSDSEVILHLYEEKKEGLLEDLNGMFSFCIYDTQEGKLFLARDRVGIKPLYFYHENGFFAFSSEMKGLLVLPQTQRGIEPEAVNFFFTLGYIPAPYTIFKRIKKLLPAHFLTFNGHEVSVRRYWELPSNKIESKGLDVNQLIDFLEEKLRSSIKMQMESDVPLGCFLSGGIDSSLVAKIMAEEASSPIKTFTIGFEDAEFDERPFARLVSEAIKSEHKEYLVKIDEGEALEKLINYFDEPFADSSLIPTYYVSLVAKENVSVVLSGDGGDELFGGYNWYTWLLSLERVKRRLGPLTNYIARVGRFLPEGFKWRHFLSVLNLNDAEQFLERLSFFKREEKEKLIKDEWQNNLVDKDAEERFMSFFNSLEGSLLEKMSMTDFHYYLPDDILTKVDRSSMAVSLETRVPWLDHNLVEFAFSLPQELRIYKGCRKYLLKELARRILPKNFVLERKQGFCIPLAKWMKGKLGDLLRDELQGPVFTQILDAHYVKDLLSKINKTNNVELGAKLFAVLIFCMWYKKWVVKE